MLDVIACLSNSAEGICAYILSRQVIEIALGVATDIEIR